MDGITSTPAIKFVCGVAVALRGRFELRGTEIAMPPKRTAEQAQEENRRRKIRRRRETARLAGGKLQEENQAQREERQLRGREGKRGKGIGRVSSREIKVTEKL